MNIGKSIGPALNKMVSVVENRKPEPKHEQTPEQEPTGTAGLEPRSKGIGAGLQNVVSAAGSKGTGEVHETTPEQEPTGQAGLQPRQAESFQERYNQDRFE